MKLISLRCAICDHWYSAKRNHCPCCGSTRRVMGVHYNHEKIHRDNKFVQVVAGIPKDYALRLQLTK
jgi:hypothetical protein